MELISSLYTQYIYFGPLFVFVLSLSRLISKERLRVNYIYSLSYFVMGLGMVQVISFSLKPFPGYFYVSHFLIPFLYATPYFLYLRFRFLIQGGRMKISVSAILCFLSLYCFLFLGILPCMNDFVKENIELRPVFDPSFISLPLYFKVVHLLNFTGKFILSFGLLNLIIRTRALWKEEDKEIKMTARLAYVFTITMFITSLVGTAGDIFSFELSKASVAMVNTVTLGIFFASQYDPEYYVIFKHLRKKKKYASSKIRGLDVDSVIENLDRLMTESQLYRDENLSLGMVAEIMNINSQQLSEIINTGLNMTFNSYVNDFKLRDAKKLLLEEPDMTVLRISMMTGFNSVRTFNRAFLKNTGFTPLEYRKKNQ